MTQELRRYYLYNFVTSFVDVRGGYLTMTYLYLHGFSASTVVSAILSYAVSCLLFLGPAGWILERLGPQTMFRLSVVPQVLTFLIFINLTPDNLPLILLWQACHAGRIMFERIPYTAYFSEYGENGLRGAQIGLSNNVRTVASIILPVVAASLIDRQGIVLWATITLVVEGAAVFLLRFDQRVRFRNPVRLRELARITPWPATRAFFVSSLPYAFVADLFAIFVALTLGSFTVLGFFLAIRVAADLVMNLLVGRLVDRGKARPFFVAAVFIMSLFWFVVPFATSPLLLFALQFTVGLVGLGMDVPFDTAYHNLAKDSGRPLEFSLWREYAHQAGLAVGCVATLVLLRFAPWQHLLPLGAIAPLGALSMLRYIGRRTPATLRA